MGILQKGKRVKQGRIRAGSLGDPNYRITHLSFSGAPAGFTESATLEASENASLTPRFRIAEHSIVPSAGEHFIFVSGCIPKYLSAPIRFATARPSS